MLKDNVLVRKEIANGYRYAFKGSDKMLADLVSIINAERACCGFFTFKLSTDDVNADILFTITDQEGAKDFINKAVAL